MGEPLPVWQAKDALKRDRTERTQAASAAIEKALGEHRCALEAEMAFSSSDQIPRIVIRIVPLD